MKRSTAAPTFYEFLWDLYWAGRKREAMGQETPPKNVTLTVGIYNPRSQAASLSEISFLTVCQLLAHKGGVPRTFTVDTPFYGEVYDWLRGFPDDDWAEFKADVFWLYYKDGAYNLPTPGQAARWAKHTMYQLTQAT